MKALNLSNVEEAKEYEKLKPGGYICRITAVMDEVNKEYLRIEYDIAEGKYKEFYKRLYESKTFWGGFFNKSYKEKARPFFKAFITAVRESNNSFIWHDDGENDENTLKGKYIGLVLGEEEYKGNDGTVKTRLYVSSVRSIASIKKGDFKIPELKKIVPSESSWGDVSEQLNEEDELPW